ncbi:MAG: helix-turn-helix domain-containing protein [Acidobacteria bacterium]|nr:helix-turn-helix domain-containing protein [Acidobacteriota bacterium]
MKQATKRSRLAAESGYHPVSSVMVKRRKSKVELPPVECPLRQCMNLISGAWTADLIWYLRAGERCFTELQFDLKGISAKVLTARLRFLEREHVIARLPRPTSPPTVFYALTPLGLELLDALTSVMEVGQRLKLAK